ncbi:MAG: hypothetical protein OXH84_04115 [Gammaproteobacteria bacterium]|nr:hypothetical protein [Gammaproteobacteria bacterium]
MTTPWLLAGRKVDRILANPPWVRMTFRLILEEKVLHDWHETYKFGREENALHQWILEMFSFFSVVKIT